VNVELFMHPEPANDLADRRALLVLLAISRGI